MVAIDPKHYQPIVLKYNTLDLYQYWPSLPKQFVQQNPLVERHISRLIIDARSLKSGRHPKGEVEDVVGSSSANKPQGAIKT